MQIDNAFRYRPVSGGPELGAVAEVPSPPLARWVLETDVGSVLVPRDRTAEDAPGDPGVVGPRANRRVDALDGGRA